MTRPTRESAAGRAYLDLQNAARRQGRPTQELLDLYALEGLLDRLSRSPFADTFVLKGGVLLAAFDARRPTRDIDLYARALANDAATVLAAIREIAAVASDDGLTFDAAGATAETIRDEDEYSGVRVTLTAHLATAELRLHVDVNVGDAVWPEPGPVDLPRLLGGTLTVRGYPLVMVYAEKLVTALQRGTANTRWRDFADVYLLSRQQPVDADDLARALVHVATHRRAGLSSLASVLDSYPDIAQARWQAWRRKQRLDDHLPVDFADLLAEIVAFADPVITGSAAGTRWDPAARAWGA